MPLEIDDINIGGFLSANTVSATTIIYGGQPIQNVFIQNVAGGYLPISGGTVTGNTVFTQGFTASTISANTINVNTQLNVNGSGIFGSISGTNIFSGSTNLQNSFNAISSQLFTKANLSGATFTGQINTSSLSATTLSGGTILSGGTNLYNIFSTIGSGSGGSGSFNQPGSNITTGGTSENQTISVVSSPSFNNLSLSGQLTSIDGISGNTFSGNTITLNETTTPLSPNSAATIFVRNKGGRRMAGQIGPSGIDYTFQPSVYGNKIAFWNPPGNATTVPGVVGMAALTATGTATLRNVATTNLFTRTKRLSVVSAAANGSLCGYRLGVAQYTVGNGSGLGGFMYVIRFGVADTNTATRMFVGLRNTTAAPTNVEPSGITNCIGIGNGGADTNLKIFYGGSVSQTPIDLGVNFPCNTNSTDLYELTLFSPPNSNNTVGYRVERLNTGDVASGTLTGVAGTAIPASTTLLTLNDFRTNNASGGAVAIDYVSIYIETDY